MCYELPAGSGVVVHRIDSMGDGFAVELDGDGSFRVRGARIERIAAQTNFDVEESAERFQRSLARFGIGARNLRAFRTAANRESSLLEAVIGPALRSRSDERRQAALGDLQRLAQSAQELADLLLRRNVRHLVE
jgi:Obg family GTPase CgtA-like protein